MNYSSLAPKRALTSLQSQLPEETCLKWPPVTCEVFGQVRVVHQTVTGKLYTLQSDRNMDVVKPLGKRNTVNTGNKRPIIQSFMLPLRGYNDTHLPK